jgi:hypothetical protein
MPPGLTEAGFSHILINQLVTVIINSEAGMVPNFVDGNPTDGVELPSFRQPAATAVNVLDEAAARPALQGMGYGLSRQVCLPGKLK